MLLLLLLLLLQPASAPFACNPLKRNLVIGASFGSKYNAEALRPFITSFVDAGLSKHAEVFLLVHASQKNPGLVSLANKSSVQLMVAEVDYQHKASLRNIGIHQRNSTALRAQPNSMRWFHTYSALVTWAHCFDKVVSTDTRDAFFQADPFVHITRPGFFPTQEQIRVGVRTGGQEAGKRNGECCTLQHNPWNRGWLNAISPHAADELVRQYDGYTPILCSGVSLGTTDAFRAYLRAVLAIFGTMSTKQFRQAGEGVDQGVHNLVAWKRLIPGVNVTVLTNEEGPVFHNVCWEPQWGTDEKKEAWVRSESGLGVQASRLHFSDEYGALMNGHRTMVAAIVHQYDRCPHVVSKLIQRKLLPERAFHKIFKRAPGKVPGTFAPPSPPAPPGPPRKAAAMQHGRAAPYAAQHARPPPRARPTLVATPARGGGRGAASAWRGRGRGPGRGGLGAQR